jgi:diacylglycerol kinase family enzyme
VVESGPRADECESIDTSPPGGAAGRADRAWLILNPRSLRASLGNLADDIRALARKHDVELIEASEPSALTAAIDRAVAAGGATLAVVAGDGTVQAIADYLARAVEADRRPALLVLGGGRTNLIAADLGGTGSVLAKLSAHLSRLASGAHIVTEERHTFVVEQHPAPARHGFFLAGAHVDSIIRAVHTHRLSGSTALHIGHLSTPSFLLKLAIARLRGRSPLAATPDLSVDAGALGALSGPTRLFAASALSHTGALVNPFADRGNGGLRLTVVTARARGFFLHLPQILLGRYCSRMTPQAGYLSGRCERVEVTGLARYVLDGEEFDCDPARAVVIRVGPSLRFVVPDVKS